ncbi:hypothetical protein ACLOJK_001976 [Asimina triloba]
MASFSSSHALFCSPKCSYSGENDKSGNSNKHPIKINGFSSTTKNATILMTTSTAPPAAAEKLAASSIGIIDQANRQNIPTKKQSVDHFRQGLITDGGVGYTQTVVVRSYEVGADKTATLETILNLLQAMRTKLGMQQTRSCFTHVGIYGMHVGNRPESHGFGATHGMMKNNLIWVVTRMQVQVDSCPIWGEVVDINTWVGTSGKNGMRRDWVIRSHLTGHVFARATRQENLGLSFFLILWEVFSSADLYKKTRRLSKMPDEVRAEISPWFIDRYAIEENGQEKIIKLDDNAMYVNSDLKPKRSDLDMNHHVNNVKYVRWMLETIPEIFLETHQLSSIVLEYRRECGSSDIVQSLCQPDENSVGFYLGTQLFDGNGHSCAQSYTHLLQIKGSPKNEEIVRGRTTWKKRL